MVIAFFDPCWNMHRPDAWTGIACEENLGSRADASKTFHLNIPNQTSQLAGITGFGKIESP